MTSQRVIDLSFSVENGMTTFPVHWHPRVEVTVLGRLGIEKRETRKLVLGTHTGTHCDAPRHFIEGGKTIDEYGPDRFIGEAFLVDLTDIAPGHEISRGELEARLPSSLPDKVILRYDWSEHWGDMSYYSDHAFLSEDAARLIVERGTKLLGMDTPMPDNPANGFGCPVDSPNHKIILGADCLLLEYLTNLSELRGPRIEILAAPMKVTGGDGAPTRCFGWDVEEL